MIRARKDQPTALSSGEWLKIGFERYDANCEDNWSAAVEAVASSVMYQIARAVWARAKNRTAKRSKALFRKADEIMSLRR
jgi:hypothetical protein